MNPVRIFVVVLFVSAATLLRAGAVHSADVMHSANVAHSADAVTSAAQIRSPQYCFEQLNTANSSLSNDEVTSIAFDSKGFAWIGTKSGLNRYDGNILTSFYAWDLGLNTAYIRKIFVDSRGLVWVGTDTGLTMYDPETRKFTPVSQPSLQGTRIENRIPDINEDADGHIWVAVGDQGVFCITVHTRSFPFGKFRAQDDGVISLTLNNYFYTNGHMTLPVGLTAFCFDTADAYSVAYQTTATARQGGMYYASYYDNLYYISLEDLLGGAPKGEEVSTFFKGDHILGLQKASDGYVYVASLNKGLCRFSPQRPWLSEVIVPCGTSHVSSLALAEDKVVVTSSSGAWEYNLADGSLTHYANVPDNDYSLAKTESRVACYNAQGELWVGCAGGVSYYNSTISRFRRFDSLQDGISLHDANITNFALSNDGSVWIASSLGVLRYQPKGTHVNRHSEAKPVGRSEESGESRDPSLRYTSHQDDGKPSPRHDLSLYPIPSLKNALPLCVCEYKDNLFVGCYNGLYRVSLKDGSCKSYSRINTQLQSIDNYVHALFYSAAEDALLVGTSLGLSRWIEATDTFEPISSFERMSIEGIAETPDALWVATFADGLVKYNTKTHEIEKQYKYDKSNPSSIPNNKCLSVTACGGTIYVTTAGTGLAALDPLTDVFTHYNTATLPNLKTDVLYRIVPSGENHLWITSDKGLVLFEPQKASLVHFTSRDGLLDDAYYQRSAIALPGGSVLLGSTNGFVEFSPRELLATKANVDPVFLEGPEILRQTQNDGKQILRCAGASHQNDEGRSHRNDDKILRSLRSLQNDEAHPLHDEGCLQASHQNDGKAILKTRQRDLHWQVSPARFSPLSAAATEYQLIGYDATKHILPQDGRISYTNLAPGRYRLEITGMESPIDIKIFRHPLKSILAISVYVILLIIVIILIARNLHRVRKAMLVTHRQLPENLKNISHPDREFLKKVENIVSNRISDTNFDAEALAHDLSISRATLNRKLKALLEVSPGEYIKKYRLETAAKMLQDTTCRINEVCFNVGFATPFYFSKCFKEHFGILPSEYAAKFKK